MNITRKDSGFYTIENVTVEELLNLYDSLNAVATIMKSTNFDSQYDEDNKKELSENLNLLIGQIKKELGSKIAESVYEGVIRKAFSKLSQH